MFKNFFNDSNNNRKYCLDSRTPSIELDETIPYQKRIKDALSKLDNEINVNNQNTNDFTNVNVYNYVHHLSWKCDCSNNCNCFEIIQKNNGNIKSFEKNNREIFLNILNSPPNLTPR